MSSLLQFNGKIDRDGVHIQAYLIPEDGPSWADPLEVYRCERCGQEHARLFTFARKPAGTFGPWVVFRWNGEEHVPDLSCPFGVKGRLPKGAAYLSDRESSEVWHSS